MTDFDACRFDFRFDKKQGLTRNVRKKSDRKSLTSLPAAAATLETAASAPAAVVVTSLNDVTMTDTEMGNTATTASGGQVGNFKCKICRKSFGSEEFLLEHRLKQHEVNVSTLIVTYVCLFCWTVVKSTRLIACWSMMS